MIYNCIAANCGAFFLPDNQGNLFGASSTGIFELTPNSGTTWTYNTIYTFNSSTDGSATSAMTFDNQGNIFGFNSVGGKNSAGTAFELSRAASGGWDFTLLFSFAAESIPALPDGIGMPTPGEIVGTTVFGGSAEFGSAFTLKLGSNGWSETVVHNFKGSPNDGNAPGRLLQTPSGNFFGLAGGGSDRCSAGCGVLFEVIP